MKTMLTAVGVALTLIGGLGGCASQGPKATAGAPAGKYVVAETCPWPRNAAYSASCKATYKAPTRSATPVSYGTRECSWPIRNVPKIC